MKLLNWTVTAILLFLCVNAFGKNQAHLSKPAHKGTPAKVRRIKQGTQISISAYNKEKDRVTVVILATPSIGPNLATSSDLFDALGTDKASNQRQNPDRLIGSELSLQKDLRLLDIWE